MKWNRTGTGTDEMESDRDRETDEMESDRDRNG